MLPICRDGACGEGSLTPLCKAHPAQVSREPRFGRNAREITCAWKSPLCKSVESLEQIPREKSRKPFWTWRNYSQYATNFRLYPARNHRVWDDSERRYHCGRCFRWKGQRCSACRTCPRPLVHWHRFLPQSHHAGQSIQRSPVRLFQNPATL